MWEQKQCVNRWVGVGQLAWEGPQEEANLKSNFGHNYKIEVDGGINDKTIVEVKNAGADIVVSGSYIFNAQNVIESISKLK